MIVTFAIFIGMGQMLSVDNKELLSLNRNLNVEPISSDGEMTKESTQGTTSHRINKPQAYQFTQAPVQVLRDKALLESIELNGLPSTSELMSSLDISLNIDRNNAQQSIDLAMSDIRSMIDIGELNNARERYVQLKSIQLKQHCPPCRLPETLDAFYIDQSNRAASTKTG